MNQVVRPDMLPGAAGQAPTPVFSTVDLIRAREAGDDRVPPGTAAEHNRPARSTPGNPPDLSPLSHDAENERNERWLRKLLEGLDASNSAAEALAQKLWLASHAGASPLPVIPGKLIPLAPLAAAHVRLVTELAALGPAAPISLAGAGPDDLVERAEHFEAVTDAVSVYLTAIVSDTADNMSAPKHGMPDVDAAAAYFHDMRAETSGAMRTAADDMEYEAARGRGDAANRTHGGRI